MRKWVEIMMACLLAGCASLKEPASNQKVEPKKAQQAAKPVVDVERKTAIDPKILYLLLAAEIAGQRNQYHVALDAYLQAAKQVKDPRIAERAAQIGLYVKDPVRTDEAVNLWLQRDADNLTARKVAALSALRTGKKDKAIEHLNAILKQDPAGFEAILVELGQLMENDGDEAFLFDVLTDMSVQHPDLSSIYFVQALLSGKMGNIDQALEKNQVALRLQPEWKKALILQARLYGRKKDLASARKYLELALAQTPEDAQLRKMLAQVMMDSEAYDDAVELYEQVLDEDPGDPESLFAIALIYLDQKKFDESEKYLDKLLSDPDWKPQADFYLGRIAFEQKQFDTALTRFDQVTQGHFVFDARLAAVTLLLGQKRFEEAEERIDNMAEQFPGHSLRILLLRAELYNGMEEFQKAFDLITEALQSRPDNRELLYTRALLAERLDKMDVLEADLQQILAKNPDDAGALNALGYTLVDRTDRYKEAAVYLEKAIQLEPDSAVITDSYGWLMYKLGRLDEALKYLQKAYDEQPENEIAAHLAEVLWMSGEKEKAREMIEDKLSQDPDDRFLKSFQQRFLQNSE